MLQKYIFTLASLVAFYQHAEIEASYVTHQIELQNTVKNYAGSINNKGTIAGQLEAIDPLVEKKMVIDYFWNLDQPEPVVITTEGDPGNPPWINNHGQVAGIIKKKSIDWWEGDDWWQRDTREVYLYDPNEGLKLLGKPNPQSGKISIVGFSDEGRIDIHGTGYSETVWGQRLEGYRLIKEERYLWSNYSLPEVMKVSASNRKGNWLLSVNHDGLIYDTRYLMILNTNTIFSDFPAIHRDKKIKGIALNDNNQFVAMDEDGTAGFFWPDLETCVELGDFLPVALNNHGDIVGRKDESFFLRKADSSMIDLNALLDQKLEKVTGISDDGHILGITEIDGQEKVLFLQPIE